MLVVRSIQAIPVLLQDRESCDIIVIVYFSLWQSVNQLVGTSLRLRQNLKRLVKGLVSIPSTLLLVETRLRSVIEDRVESNGMVL